MNRIFKAFFLAVSLFFAACGDDNHVAKIIVTDRKMPLAEWPDSAYIAALDSILALEPIKKNSEAEANINMNVFEAPVFKLPGSVTGKKDSKPNHASKSTTAKQTGVARPAGNSNANAEAFAGKFTAALSRLQSDPTNAGLYRTVEAQDGEDLFKLLKRTYGAGVQGLPRFYVLSALQSVNAGVVLEHLNAGDKVRIPKLSY